MDKSKHRSQQGIQSILKISSIARSTHISFVYIQELIAPDFFSFHENERQAGYRKNNVP